MYNSLKNEYFVIISGLSIKLNAGNINPILKVSRIMDTNIKKNKKISAFFCL